MAANADLEISLVYIVTAGASVICCSVVLLLNVCERALSRFPSSLMMWRMVCDLLLSLQFVFVNARHYILVSYDPTTTGEHVCTEWLAFLVQFGLFGSLLWYGCLSANLYLSITRPFTRPDRRTPLYHAVVWLGSATTGAIAAATHGYRQIYHFCWTHADPAGDFNVDNWLLLFGWVILCSVLSTFVLLHSHSLLLFGGSDRKRKRAQLQHRLRPRLAQLRASKLYTLAFSVYWVVLGTLYLALFTRYELQDYPLRDPPRFLFAAVLGLMGCCDSLVWVGVQAAVQPAALNAAVRALPQLLCRPCGALAEWVRLSLGRFRPQRLSSASSWIGARAGRAQFGGSVCPHAPRSRLAPRFTISDTRPPLDVLGLTAPLLHASAGSQCAGARPGDGGSDESGHFDEWRGDDISDSLRRDLVRFTIVGIASSTRAVNVEAACAAPAGAAAVATPRHRPVGSPRSRTTLARQSLLRRAAALVFGPSYEEAAGPSYHAAVQHTARAPPVVPSPRPPTPTPAPASAPSAAPAPAPAMPAMPAMPAPHPWHFSEVHTIELAPHVYFQDFAPVAWQLLRQAIHGVSFPEYTRSLTGVTGTGDAHSAQIEASIEAMVGRFSEGAGGGFFFFSPDGRYLLKTLERREQRKLLQALPSYFEHLRASPRSLLARLFGCYAITMHDATRYFVVMESLFHGVERIHEKYDLKGSWVGRSVRTLSRDATLLDNDLARKLKLPPRDAARLAAQCARDAQLLRALNIMDYSLLLGVRLVAPSERAGPAAAARHDGPCVWTSEDGHAIYYVTIIDLLQSWDLGKQLERLLKLGFYCRCGSAEGLSVVEPAQYAHRFIQMVERILDQPSTSDDP